MRPGTSPLTSWSGRPCRQGARRGARRSQARLLRLIPAWSHWSRACSRGPGVLFTATGWQKWIARQFGALSAVLPAGGPPGCCWG